MALNYLLSPEFQIVNSAGRPASGGFLEVYVHGTRDKYFCASDFDGTLHPFRVPLDSLGSNVVLADDAHAYDVYIYNRYGTLLMSRYNVSTSSGGAMGGVITSTDGSITVTPTVDGYDLSTRDNKASTLRAAAEPLYSDGFYSFRKLEGEGESIYIDNGNIKLEDGWYHFSATVKLNWNGNITPHTGTIRLYSGLTYDIVDFDYSYNHSDSILLDGDVFIGAHSSHYISFGRNFTLGITGMPTGMTAELVDCDIHSIIGQGVGGNGEKNIHRLLRYYTNESEADAQHPVGDWLHDLDAEDPSDPSGHPMVTADQLFAWYDEGQIFELYEVDGSNGQLGWSAVYRMVTWQDQSDWWSQFAPVPGKACRLEFYRMGGYSSINRGMMIAYIRYKEEDYMRLYQIMPGQDVWTMDFQPELTAGSNISISGSTISATDTTYTAGTGLSLTGTEFSADTSVLATKSDLAGKQDVLTAGQNITIDSSNVISATDTTYTAGTGIDITGTTISADTSVVATQSDLAGKQDTLTAGTGITIQNNVISATADQQVQSNWNETDTADPSYIQNKPDLSIYAESADLATVASTGDYDDLLNKPSIPSFDSTQMAAINSGVNSTKVGNYDAHIADTDIHVTTSDKSTWNAKQDAISDLNTIRSGAQAGSTAVQPGDLAAVAITGSYDDLTNKPTIPAAQVQSDWSESDSSAVSYIQNKPSNLVQDASYVHTDENFTSAEKTKLAGIESGAEVNVQSDWNESDSSSDAYIQNKPTIPAAQVNSDWNASSGVAQILNKPDLSVYATQSDLNGKQDTLTAGSNISISNNTISATDTTYTAGTGLSLTGTTFAADTTVLATKSDLAGKQDTLTAGSNISISNNVISATDTTYTFSNPLKETSGVVSLDYDTDTLSASTTAWMQFDTFYSSASGQAVFRASQGGRLVNILNYGEPNSTISLHIPGNAYFSANYASSQSYFISLSTAPSIDRNPERTITYIGHPLATEQITVYGTPRTAVAEQDVVINFADLSDTSLWTEKQFNFTGYVYLAIVMDYSDTTSIANAPLTSVDDAETVPVKALATTAGPLTVKDPIPAHTSSDSGKVLGVDSNGDTAWTTPSGAGGADWDATSGEPGYIENKPTEKTLVAGTNVTITESASSVTISSTDTTYTAGTGVDITSGVISADTSVLATQSDLSSKQDTLTAGSNITISNNVISAASQVQSDWTESDTSSAAYIDNKPDLVDIVAGPGIVVDNPDGNTLRVSMAADYEVELFYSPTNHDVANNAEFAMSESIWNFSKVLITFDNMEFVNRTCTMLIDLAAANTGTYFTTPYCNGDTPGSINIPWASFNINAAGNIKYLKRGLIYGTWTAPAFTTGTSRGYRVKRVVGINRISNN